MNMKHVILVDLSTVTKVDEITVSLIKGITAHLEVAENVIGVMAHSSGGESWRTAVGGGGGSFKVDFDLVSRFYSYTEVRFVTFSDGEAAVYWTENKGILALKDLKSLTNYNALLLKACLTRTSYASAYAVVWSVAQRTGQDVLQSLRAENAVWHSDNIQTCITMLYHAANHLDLPCEHLSQYETSWLSTEGMTYIADMTGAKFSPRVNFPLLVSALMNFLRTNNEMGDTRCNDIMKGYRFEYTFLRHTGELCLTCTEVGGAPTCYTFKGLICQHTVEGEALNSIGINSLVHLRDSHPVIDAVAKLKDQNNNQWLLLVQVSLSCYARHHSKVGDLLKSITWPEKENRATSANWMQYYQDMCEPGTKTMYVYISPNQIDDNPEDVMRESGIRSNTKFLCLGLVTRGSQTHNNIKQMVWELNTSTSST